jgi:hypothetical protein
VLIELPNQTLPKEAAFAMKPPLLSSSQSEARFLPPMACTLRRSLNTSIRASHALN